jgi:hypothetical protein
MVRPASVLGWSLVFLGSGALMLHILGLIWITLAAHP